MCALLTDPAESPALGRRLSTSEAGEQCRSPFGHGRQFPPLAALPVVGSGLGAQHRRGATYSRGSHEVQVRCAAARVPGVQRGAEDRDGWHQAHLQCVQQHRDGVRHPQGALEVVEFQVAAIFISYKSFDRHLAVDVAARLGWHYLDAWRIGLW